MPNADLQQSADQHNNDMVAQDYFAHNGPAGDTPLSRIEATGYLSNPNDSYVDRREHRLGHAQPRHAERDRQRVGQLARPPGEHPQPSYTDTGMSVSPQAPASLAEGQQGAIYTQDFGGIDTSGN